MLGLLALASFAVGLGMGFVLWADGAEVRAAEADKRRLMAWVEQNPNDDGALRNLAGLLVRQQEYAKALPFAERAVSIDRDNPANWQRVGFCALQLYEVSGVSTGGERERLRKLLEEAGLALLSISKSRQESGTRTMTHITYLLSAEVVLSAAGEVADAEEARRMALQTAREWSSSESTVERDLGDTYLRVLQGEDDTANAGTWSVTGMMRTAR